MMEFSQPPPGAGAVNFNIPPPQMPPPIGGPPMGGSPMGPPPPHQNQNHHGGHHGGHGGYGQQRERHYHNYKGGGSQHFRPFTNFGRGPGAMPMTQDDFDGKRLRKSVMRKTVDYNSAIVRALEVSFFCDNYNK